MRNRRTVARRRTLAAAATLVAAALTLAACSGTTTEKTRPTSTATSGSSQDTTTSTFNPTDGVDSDLIEFYSQQVTWEECGDNMRCTDVVVPMDYENPTDGRTVTLAVTMIETAGDGAPALFLNPGGPGGSGVDMMDWITYSISADTQAAYNLVGFDPRGVNHSDAVECISDAEMDDFRSLDIDTSTDAGLEQYATLMQDFGADCETNTGDLLQYVDTVSAAKDLDILRAVVGSADTLDYLGYSYGTFLGSQYAELFPQRVGHFVLDGALDPSSSIADLALGQAAGFEKSIRAYLEDCLAGSGCPFTGTVDDAEQQLTDFLALVEATPLPTGDPDRPLTYSLALSGILLPMYENAIWPNLTQALTAAIENNDGTELLYWADYGASRNDDGTYADNSTEAFYAIDCLDYPVEGTLEDWKATAAEIAEANPAFGDALAYTEIACDAWPYKSTRTPTEFTAAGSAPILVVGTTGDPATPYEWAVALADQLENGYLLTYDGWGHTAYGRSNECVTSTVDAYLLDGTLPDDGATC